MEYPVLYASAKNGWVGTSLDDQSRGVIPLLDAIVKHVPAPHQALVEEGSATETGTDVLSQPFALAVNTIQYDQHLGRIVTGKVEYGSIKLGDRIKVSSFSKL